MFLRQRFYYFLHLRSLNPEAEVPPVDEALRCIAEPEKLLLAGSEYGVRQFCKELALTPNVQVPPRSLVLTNLSAFHLEMVFALVFIRRREVCMHHSAYRRVLHNYCSLVTAV